MDPKAPLGSKTFLFTIAAANIEVIVSYHALRMVLAAKLKSQCWQTKRVQQIVIYILQSSKEKYSRYSYNTCHTCNYGPARNSTHSLDSYVGYGQAFTYIANDNYPVPEKGLVTAQILRMGHEFLIAHVHVHMVTIHNN